MIQCNCNNEKSDMMKRFLKLVGIPFVIALGIFLFIKFVWLKGFEFTDMTVDEYVTFYNSNNEGIIYVTEENATMKVEFEEVIGKNFEGKNIEVYKLDLTNVSGDEEQTFIDANEFTNEQYVIPMLIYIKDGAVVDIIEGYVPDYKITEFIANNNIK